MRKTKRLWVALSIALTVFVATPAMAGLQDRGSKIDLMPDPDNYIRLPEVGPASSVTKTPVAPAGETRLYNDGGGLVYQGGTTEAPTIAEEIVLIDHFQDLTFFSGDTSGNSVFLMEWGKRYIVDPHAIATSGLTIPLSGTSAIYPAGVFSEVTGILPWVGPGDHLKTVSVEMAQLGVTGWIGWGNGGVTPVTVWAPVNSAATTYEGNDSAATGFGGSGASPTFISGATHQTLLVTYTLNGLTSTYQVGDVPGVISGATAIVSGASDYELDRLGEWKRWRAYHGSGISIVPVEKNVHNTN